MKFIKSITLITLAFFTPITIGANLLLPKNAFAQIDIGTAFRFGDKPVNEVFNSLSALVNAILPNIFVIAGVIFLVLLIFAGVGVILSSGSGNPEGAKKAKAAATSAATGLFLIFAAYWIMEILQFITGIKFFNSILK